MANAGRLTLGLVLAATVAHAGPCEEERSTLGVTVANRGGTLVIDAVDAGSPAARTGLLAGDEVWQVNATVPHVCLDWAKALRDARHDRKAVLVLVRRETREVALVLGAAVWVPPAVPEPGTPVAPPAPARPGTPPAVVASGPEPTVPPATLPLDVAVSVNDVLDGLRRLAPLDRPPINLRAYTDEIKRLRRAIETLAARHTAPPETILGLRAVLRYFDGAEVAWKAIDQQREREHRPAHMPVGEEMTAEYFEDSAPAAVIEEFPFLAPTVTREPRRWLAESAGLWHPAMARRLLWEKGREATEQLGVGVGGPR